MEHEHDKILDDEDAPETDEVEGVDEEDVHHIPDGLLELHLELEEQGVTAEEFKEAFNS